MSDIGYWMLDIGHRMADIGCWISDAGEIEQQKLGEQVGKRDNPRCSHNIYSIVYDMGML